jgi:hypothetical protein
MDRKVFIFLVIGPTGKEKWLYAGGAKGKTFFITNKQAGVDKLMPSARRLAATIDPKLKLVVREFEMVGEQPVIPGKLN